jgi:hypothetical protein
MGLSSTTDKQKGAAWRVEFEALGEQLVFEKVKQGAIYNDETKRQAALRWLSERGRTAQLVWCAFFVAIAGVLISIIGLLVAVYWVTRPLPADLVCINKFNAAFFQNVQHAATMFFPHFVGDGGSRRLSSS